MEIVKLTKYGLKLLDQRKLPLKKEYVMCRDETEVAGAIRDMVVRGAPAIGVAGAYGMALSKNPIKASSILSVSRPTAVDLSNAIGFMLNEIKMGKDKTKSAKEWHTQIIKKTKKIAEYGATLIKNGDNILLHCNAGPLATAGYGTSLGAVIEAKKQKKKIFAYVDETRPRFQGALTSFELLENNIMHKVIVDSASGILMRRGMIDAVMVGADRIVKNGDFANKIGTYNIAVLANENKIPFYVFAPISTFDFGLRTGNGIKIEERDEKEILEICNKRIYPKRTRALNLAFDITPSRYVSAYITEFGVHKDIKEIERIWKNTLG